MTNPRDDKSTQNIEETARVGAQLLQHNAETLQNAWRSGLDMAAKAMGRSTGYLLYLLDQIGDPRVEIITPRDPGQRGCAVSLLIQEGPRDLLAHLERLGIVCDFRPPNVVRVAPVPLYNTFEEVWQFVHLLSSV